MHYFYDLLLSILSALFVFLSGRCKDSSWCLAHWPSRHRKDFDGQGSGRCRGFHHVPPLEPLQNWLTVIEVKKNTCPGFWWWSFYKPTPEPPWLRGRIQHNTTSFTTNSFASVQFTDIYGTSFKGQFFPVVILSLTPRHDQPWPAMTATGQQVRLECLSSNPLPPNSSNSSLGLELRASAISSSKPRCWWCWWCWGIGGFRLGDG